jgi:hypothetical protein
VQDTSDDHAAVRRDERVYSSVQLRSGEPLVGERTVNECVTMSNLCAKDRQPRPRKISASTGSDSTHHVFVEDTPALGCLLAYCILQFYVCTLTWHFLHVEDIVEIRIAVDDNVVAFG